ncbi:beta-1,6-galactofuranosyltransferase [Secundilactobacillus paracollinoides]|nr:beta-1,6-galactofuranosyltransferase [Secundilactobacillus paracollinoides]
MAKKIKGLRDTMIVFQYPMYSRICEKVMLKSVKKKENVKTVVIVHDVDSLRFGKHNKKKVSAEIKYLNEFDCLVVHNNHMKKWLEDNGIRVPMVSLGIFDYENSNNQNPNYSVEDGLVFAGNLWKSAFLKQINIKTKIQLLGPNPLSHYPQNIRYDGQYSPEEVPMHFKAAFGLVWDGDLNDNNLAEYTMYNNPHKASLYLSSGLPVIVWKDAALSDFVVSNKVGFVISKLDDIDSMMNQITQQDYHELKKNVKRISLQMRSGYYIKTAMENVRRALKKK